MFDIFHITGHAGHAKNGEPIFLTESDIGERVDATAEMLHEALNPMPRLLFLSGCRTAQSPGEALPSLAEALPDKGAQAVLGWGRPVYDADGVAAARAFYGQLAVGASLTNALAAPSARCARSSLAFTRTSMSGRMNLSATGCSRM